MTDQELKDLFASFAVDREQFGKQMQEFKESLLLMKDNFALDHKNFNDDLNKIKQMFEEDRKRADEDRKRADEDRKKAEEDRKKAEAEAEEKRKKAEAEAEEKRKKAEAEAEERRKKAEAEKRESKAEMKKLQAIVGGMGNNNGDFAEDFFYYGLKENPNLLGFKHRYRYIDRRVKRDLDNIKGEFDIVLTNSDSLVICEVKYKFHPKDVSALLTQIENYKVLFPNTQKYKIYGAIAALAMPEETASIGKELGFFVLTQAGKHIKVLNDKTTLY